MDIVPVPGGVLHVDGVGVGEHDVHLGPGQLGLTHVVLQFVSFNTTASIISIFVVIVSVVMSGVNMRWYDQCSVPR